VIKRLRSWRHAFWFALSRRIRWSRGPYREKPAGQLRRLTPDQAARVAALRGRYQVQFEQRLGERSSTINYEYLDILDRAWMDSGRTRPSGGVMCDVGCASFWYAAALHAFFRPDRLIGVEIEGHRLFRDGRARIDYASGYVADVPNAEFVVADYTRYEQPADTITAWFPFLTSTAILAWRLPLSLLRPESLFARIRHNLNPNGVFVMVNHGPSEADLAAVRCTAAGFVRVGLWQDPGALSSYRLAPPVLSWWQHPP
jgi:SAM-dependent methyltransferase